ESDPASIPAPNPSRPVTEPAGSAANSLSSKTSLPAAAIPGPNASSAGARSFGSATNANLANASGTRTAASSNNPVHSSEEVVEEVAKKPALGQVRLAAPKVTRSAADLENGTADPGLAMNAATPADSSSLSLLANKGKGPAAPLPIGGDVKVAKLISSM